MKKDLALIGGLFLIIILLLAFGGSFSSSSFFSSKDKSSTESAQKVDTVKIGDSIFKVQIAGTEDQKMAGLSNRDSLPLDEGLLFVFDKSDTHTFWMKDMKFAIDIIWIDKNKKIVDIAQNAPPEPGKKDKELKLYKPRESAKYVLEINAGLSSLNNIKIGDKVVF